MFSQKIIYSPHPSLAYLTEDERKYFQDKKFNFHYRHSFYLNSNLPNLENFNGLYLPKGHGDISSMMLNYNSKYFSIFFEPTTTNITMYEQNSPKKEGLFSVLNDVKKNNLDGTKLRNTGLIFNFRNLSIGYGNWNQWWGPGIHNSIILSNNAEGFSHFHFSANLSRNLYNKKFDVFIKLIQSNNIKNFLNENFYISNLSLIAKYDIAELGFARNILSGGRPDLKWSFQDALPVIFTSKNLKYWDTINDFYFMATFKKTGLVMFINFAIPNRSYNGKDPKNYIGHSTGSNIGFRKKGVFDIKNLEYGVEYTRLVQGIYYNTLPTPNWYDNKLYSYSSFKQRRWGAHSGSDSDDLFLYFGYGNNEKRLIFGFNYERHGVTYHFPPEVKIESKIALSYRIKPFFVMVDYESEYFEHYGFIDGSENVWNQTFEEGSLQRTRTLLFSLIFTY